MFVWRPFEYKQWSVRRACVQTDSVLPIHTRSHIVYADRHSSVSSIFTAAPSPPIDNIRVRVIVWRLRGDIIVTALCWIVYDAMFTVHSTLILAVLTGLTDWVCHIGTLTLCVRQSPIELYYCNIWWSGSNGTKAWSRRPTGFLQCFDTVGLVVWCKNRPDMTWHDMTWHTAR